MICYTTITGGYDYLKPPFVSKGWRYIVFSDRYIESDVWECYVTDKYDREIKILGHEELFHTPCLYVDGSISIKGDLNEFMGQINGWFDIWKHPHRDCIFDEAEAVIRLKGMNRGKVERQMKRYKEVPKNWGLGANGCMFRDFSDPVVRNICQLWWNEFCRGVPRDQLSLMPTFYSMGYMPDFFNNDIFNKYFIWEKHA
jgi:hypothetical protein